MVQDTARIRVVVVEDEAPLVELLRYNLEAAGFAVTSVADGDQVVATVDEVEPQLIILDWMLPNVSGIELCRRLRARPSTKSLPILMLTARGEEADRIRGLATGADDYIVKPFSVPELIARVRAILRRTDPERLADRLQMEDIEFDRAAHRVRRGTRDVHLGPTEYRLLEVFMTSAGRVLTRNQLLDHVWGRDSEIDERTIDVHVGRLRKALVQGRESDPIRTVRGAGYVFGQRD
jgi:two-component system phosphate regulon response regulator PhoB